MKNSYSFSIQFIGNENEGFVSSEEKIVVIDDEKIIGSFNRGVSEILRIMEEYFYTCDPDLIRDAKDNFYHGPLKRVVGFIENKISFDNIDYIISNPPYHQGLMELPSGDTILKTEPECLNDLKLVPEGEVPVFKIFIGEKIPTFEEMERKKEGEIFHLALESLLSQDGDYFWITRGEWNRFLERTKESDTEIKEITYVGLLNSTSIEKFLIKKRGLALLSFNLKSSIKIGSVEELKILLALLMYRDKGTKAPSWKTWKSHKNNHFFWSSCECLDGDIDVVSCRRNVFAVSFAKNI